MLAMPEVSGIFCSDDAILVVGRMIQIALHSTGILSDWADDSHALHSTA
jgi:hypothetical protein